MTPSQRRRLDAVSRIASPCFGCLHEDLFDAASNARPITDELYDAMERLHQAANAERVRKGQGPTEWHRPTPEERQQQLTNARLVEDQHRQALADMARLIPNSQRRASCPDCINRKRIREQCWSLAQRLAKNVGDRKREEAEWSQQQGYGENEPSTTPFPAP